MDLTKGIRATIEHTLKVINSRFRLNLFFVLNSKQHVLYLCYDSNKGFLDELGGIKLFVSEQFGELLRDRNRFQIHGKINSNYPFLYEGFGESSTMYVKKLSLYTEFFAFFEFLIAEPILEPEIETLIDELSDRLLKSLHEAYCEVVREISKRYICLDALNIIKTARPRTFYHSFRVGDLAVIISEELGLDERRVKDLYFSALIHDVGEIWIPNEILDKRGKLTDDEMELVKSHPMNLKYIFLHNPIIEDLLAIAIYHHERSDGSGYYGLTTQELSFESKILSICEFIDGLHTDRPDRAGLKKEEIVELLKDMRGKAFDKELVDVSITIIEKFYGNYLELDGVKSGKPVVLLFYKDGGLNLAKGVVEYSAGKNIGISLSTSENEKLKYKDRVRLQIPTLSKIADITAEVLSSTDEMVNLLILDSRDVEDKPLEVHWEFEILVIPLRVSGGTLNSSLEKFVIKMKSYIFGTKSLLAKSKDVKLSIGDTVLIKARPKGELISIPAVVSDVIDDGGIYTMRFEYFGLNEAEDAKIHRAIYSREVALSSR